MEDKFKVPFAEFDAGHFIFIIDENKMAFLSLNELISSAEIISSHLKNQVKGWEEEHPTKDMSGTTNKLNEAASKIRLLSRISGISRAALTFYKQEIVVLVTIIENMLEEFFRCMFCRYPQYMYEYLSPGIEEKAIKGKIDLKDLLLAKSREDLIRELAIRSAESAMQGKFNTILSRLQKLSGSLIPSDLIEKLQNLNELRNKIVHELSEIEVLTSEVEDSFSLAIDLATCLEQIAIQKDIPVDQ